MRLVTRLAAGVCVAGSAIGGLGALRIEVASYKELTGG